MINSLNEITIKTDENDKKIPNSQKKQNKPK